MKKVHIFLDKLILRTLKLWNVKCNKNKDVLDSWFRIKDRIWWLITFVWNQSGSFYYRGDIDLFWDQWLTLTGNRTGSVYQTGSQVQLPEEPKLYMSSPYHPPQPTLREANYSQFSRSLTDYKYLFNAQPNPTGNLGILFQSHDGNYMT